MEKSFYFFSFWCVFIRLKWYGDNERWSIVNILLAHVLALSIVNQPPIDGDNQANNCFNMCSDRTFNLLQQLAALNNWLSFSLILGVVKIWQKGRRKVSSTWTLFGKCNAPFAVLWEIYQSWWYKNKFSIVQRRANGRTT